MTETTEMDTQPSAGLGISRTKVQYLVVDSGAFIKNAPIRDLGENIYTIEEVVSEIRDEVTRARLQVLPYKINFKDPRPEYIKFVADFAKKTGDYSSLSETDIKVLALTYELEEEFNGCDHLRQEPSRIQVTDKPKEDPSSMFTAPLPGFHQPKENDNLDEEGKEGNEDIDEDDDDKDWITLSNIEEVKKELSKMNISEEKTPEIDPDRVSIGCITTDFSMQNVLLQIGLRLISVDGAVIKETRNYILRCHACFKTTTKDTNGFCMSCGNHGTLKRISVTINEKGERVMHINFKRPINIRGTRYSLPKPRTGKHAANPVLAPDQPIPRIRASKFAIQEAKAFENGGILSDPNYVVRDNPFAVNDVYSRSARLGYSKAAAGTHRNGRTGGGVVQIGRPSRNPNEAKPCTGNRKKKNRN